MLGPERRALLEVSFRSGQSENAIVVMSDNKQGRPLCTCWWDLLFGRGPGRWLADVRQNCKIPTECPAVESRSKR